jgi:acyl-CoA synthetase (AMP-forming)/AMP-acid ligase II
MQCEDCHKVFHETFHSDCDCKGLGVVLEFMYPSMRRLEVASSKNLTQAMLTIMQVWSDRPCFRSHNSDHWLTYSEVLNRSLRLVSELLSVVSSYESAQVALCFPAGSMEFYLWDIACILAGTTTIGIPVPPPPIDDWPTSVTHLVCSQGTRTDFKDFFPPNLPWINAVLAAHSSRAPYDIKKLQKGSCQIDEDNTICTIFYTSGTTGRYP